MSLLHIVQRVSTYNYIEPEYSQVIEDAVDLLNYLKENPASESDPHHRNLKGLFWEVIMKVANINQFQSKNKLN